MANPNRAELEALYAGWLKHRENEENAGHCAECELKDVCSKVESLGDYIALNLLGPDVFAAHVDIVHAARKAAASGKVMFEMPTPVGYKQ